MKKHVFDFSPLLSDTTSYRTLKDFQAIGRHPRDGKSMHTFGQALDIDSPEYWRNAANYFSRPTQHDRIISMMMMLEATKREMHKHLGIPKERMGDSVAFTGINRIHCPELLKELLNYKPKEMKKFKNRNFAVKGDIISLLQFEKKLLELGYTNPTGKDVFNYRGELGAHADYITIGAHAVPPVAGTFVPAMNTGCSLLVFDLGIQFNKAVQYASELQPLYITLDGVDIFDTKTKVYGLKQIEDTNEGNHYPKDRVYRDHVIVSTDFSMQISSRYAWFGSLEAAKKHVDKTIPVFTTEDGVQKFAGDTVWYVRPNFVYHFWKSGIKADSNIEDNLKRGYKFFSTEDGCVNYIKKNKPYFNLSQNEMQNFLDEILKPLGLAAQVDALEFPKDFVKRD